MQYNEDMSTSTMTVGSRLADRRLYGTSVITRLASRRATVRFRVETKRTARGDQSESQAYDFNLSLEDAIGLRARLDSAIAALEAAS